MLVNRGSVIKWSERDNHRNRDLWGKSVALYAAKHFLPISLWFTFHQLRDQSMSQFSPCTCTGWWRWMCKLPLASLQSQQTQSNISIQWESTFWQMDLANVSPTFILLCLSQFTRALLTENSCYHWRKRPWKLICMLKVNWNSRGERIQNKELKEA